MHHVIAARRLRQGKGVSKLLPVVPSHHCGCEGERSRKGVPGPDQDRCHARHGDESGERRVKLPRSQVSPIATPYRLT